MAYEELRAKNQPDKLIGEMMKELTVTVPVYAMPPEVFEKLLLMMTEIARHQAPMQEKIDQLPTWEEWVKEIQPEVHKAMNSHARAVDNLKSDLCRDILYRLDGQKTTLTNLRDSKLTGLHQSLQARDNTPKKRKWKLLGIGAAIGAATPLLCWGLLWLLKIS